MQDALVLERTGGAREAGLRTARGVLCLPSARNCSRRIAPAVRADATC